MAIPVCEVLLSADPLAAPAENYLPETGAVVDFWGVVRGQEGEMAIAGIEYEAHLHMAEHQLRAIADEAAATFAARQVLIHHRLGFVPTNAASLFVRVGCKHRADAFRAGQWIVDELKKRATIWKHPRQEAKL